MSGSIDLGDILKKVREQIRKEKNEIRQQLKKDEKMINQDAKFAKENEEDLDVCKKQVRNLIKLLRNIGDDMETFIPKKPKIDFWHALIDTNNSSGRSRKTMKGSRHDRMRSNVIYNPIEPSEEQQESENSYMAGKRRHTVNTNTLGHLATEFIKKKEAEGMIAESPLVNKLPFPPIPEEKSRNQEFR